MLKRVFISSVIDGFEDNRQAAKEAVEAAGMKPVMVENLPSQTYSPKQAWIKGVQESDSVLVAYGAAIRLCAR